MRPGLRAGPLVQRRNPSSLLGKTCCIGVIPESATYRLVIQNSIIAGFLLAPEPGWPGWRAGTQIVALSSANERRLEMLMAISNTWDCDVMCALGHGA